MPHHVFITLDTMGVRPGSAILGIGAVAFDPSASDPLGRTFSARIDLVDSEHLGFGIEACAVNHWCEVSLRRWREIAMNKQPVKPVLQGFSDFLQFVRQEAGGALRVWTHFKRDPAVIEGAYRFLAMRLPWSDDAELRDAGTLFELAGVDPVAFTSGIPFVPDELLTHALVKARTAAAAIRKLAA